MEVASCIKAVVMAASQYQNNTNDANTVHMQRQLDVLITVTGRSIQLKMFDPRQMLPTECLSCVADILNDKNTKPLLVHKCLILLNNLAQDSEIREMLHSVFHFTPILASLIKVSRGSSGDPILCDCLTLLQRVTYGHRIPLHESHIEDLIDFLIKNIQGTETLLTRPALGLLANLCRNNNPIKSYIKTQEKIRAFYRCLVSYLGQTSQENQSTIIFSLSILTSLCLQDHELGDKLYRGKNINRTFQLLFNILINGDSMTSRPYAVDIFIDILTNLSIQESLLVFDHLPMCLQEVLNLIPNSTHDTVVKIFEFLLSFCSVCELRQLLCRSLICVPALQDPAQYAVLYQQPSAHLNQPFLSVIHIAGQSVETHDTAPLLALDFIKEIYEELIFTNLNNEINPHIELLLPMLSEALMCPVQGQGALLKKKCQKIVKAIEILLVFCEDEGFRDHVSQSIDTNTLVKHITFQFDNNKAAINPTRAQADPQHWYEDGVDVVLFVLKLMSKLRATVSNMEENLIQALQDSRIIPFLACGITSDTRSRVQVAVSLIGSACSLSGFPAIILGDCIAANNTRRHQHQKEFTSTPVPSRSSCQSLDKENIKNGTGNVDHSNGSRRLTDDQEASLQTLIEKMQKGLDVKDIRPSEMISVYEQKLKCLQTKEHHLQDLLEAKALALTQADHLLLQYRSQRAQSEAELSRMRSLVQEAEQRSEDYREKLNSIILERETLQQDKEDFIAENRRLGTIEEDYKEMSAAFSEQSQKFEKTQKSLIALKQDHKTLSEMKEMLQRHNGNLKQQHDVATQQLADLEDAVKSTTRQLKDRETKLNDVSKSYHKLEENHISVSSEKNALEESIDKLRTDLAKVEQSKKEFQHQVTSLELLCQRHEAAIQEKDILIGGQKEEIGKHHQLAALIHNLSSGNTAPKK